MKNLSNFPPVYYINLDFREDRKNLMVLYFDDVSKNIKSAVCLDGKIREAKVFTKKQAKKLVDFIELNKDKKSCIVHCTAGISRSGAVGSFINDYYNNNSKEFYRKHPNIEPNSVVKSLLKNEYEDRHYGKR